MTRLDPRPAIAALILAAGPAAAQQAPEAPAPSEPAAQSASEPAASADTSAPTARVTIVLEGVSVQLDRAAIEMVLDPEQLDALISALGSSGGAPAE